MLGELGVLPEMVLYNEYMNRFIVFKMLIQLDKLCISHLLESSL